MLKLVEYIKYGCFKNWYLANFSFRRPARFFAELRVITIYDPIFKKEGFLKVKELHLEYLNNLRSIFDNKKQLARRK